MSQEGAGTVTCCYSNRATFHYRSHTLYSAFASALKGLVRVVLHPDAQGSPDGTRQETKLFHNQCVLISLSLLTRSQFLPHHENQQWLPLLTCSVTHVLGGEVGERLHA